MALICENKDCGQYRVPIVRVKYKWIGSALEANCEGCKSVMVDDGKSNITPGVPRINRFDGMTMEQKKEMLIKRSADDFKKNGERYDEFRRIEERVVK